MDEQKRKFSELQKEIDAKKQELKQLQKRIKPIVKELKAHMKDNGHETMTVDGYDIKIKRQKTISYTKNKVKDYAPELDWDTYDETYEKETEVLKVEKNS